MNTPSDVQHARAAYALFEEFLALPGKEREQALADLKHSNPELHPSVFALLDADRQAQSESFLDDGALGLLKPDPQPEPPGDVGVYRPERLLGVGGMGEVWLAQRADGLYQGQVAVKILHAHLSRSGIRGRFNREGQILAKLTHPNIARLLDAGITPGGLMFLVLEYVQGQRIDRWCDGRQLAIAARLKLFLSVCDAVAHAHSYLVVHRDLKPSNILVTEKGEVKLLDFGIAKLLEGTETTAATGEETELTRLGGRALTPEYAAPEQLRGETITTGTDVYALGVLLYELLCGRRPYGSAKATPAQIERDVLETNPRPPSQMSGVSSGAAEVHAAARDVTPDQLAKVLRGDLDNISLMALKKAPNDRYPSVLALRNDLQRFLSNEPVIARGDPFGYRAAKFVRRHRLGVAVTAMIFLLIMAGSAGIYWQARRAEQEAAEARAQSQRAEFVRDFVVSLFQEQNPFSRGSSITRTPQQMIAEAAKRLDQGLDQDPEVHAELLDDLGGIQLDLGDLKGSETLLQRAVEERGRRYGADSLDVAESLGKLAQVRNLQGRHDEAAQLARRALTILKSHADAAPLDVVHTERALANAISFGMGALPEAEILYRDALRICERYLGADDPETLRTLNYLAEMHLQAHDAKAEVEIRELVSRSERRYGPESVPFASALYLLGESLKPVGKVEEAVDDYARAAAILRAQAGPRGGTLSTVLTHMAVGQRQLRRFEDAEASYAQAELALPEGEMNNRADILRGKGRVALLLNQPDDAERDLRSAYELERRNLGENNGFTWYYASEWGRGLAAQGKLGEAETIQRQALKRLGEVMGPDAFQNGLLQGALADTLEMKKGGRAEAESLRRHALQLTEKKYPKTHMQWANDALDLAHNLASSGTSAAQTEGLELSGEALAVERGNNQTELLAEALLEHAGFLARTGQRDPARKEISEALEVFGRTPHPDANRLDHAKILQRRLEAMAS